MIRPLFVLYLILLIACSVTGIICTRRLKFKFSPIKLLPWFILLTLISELTALGCAIQFGNNHKVYNIYQVVQFGFFSYILTLMIGNKGVRKLLTGLSTLFTAFAILNLAFIQGMAQFNTVNYFGGAVIVSFFSLRFTPGETHILYILIMLVNYISYAMFTVAFLNYHKNNKRSQL